MNNMSDETITMPKENFVEHMVSAYRVGTINALLCIKKPIPEIARILRTSEESIKNMKKSFDYWFA